MQIKISKIGIKLQYKTDSVQYTGSKGASGKKYKLYLILKSYGQCFIFNTEKQLLNRNANKTV